MKAVSVCMLRTIKVARNVVVQRSKFWYKGLFHRRTFYLTFSMKPLKQTNKYFKSMRKVIWPVCNWFSITCMMYSNEQYQQGTYKRNTGARSNNHCRGKCYLFWLCVFCVFYPIWNAPAPYYIIICGLSDSALFFHVIS